MDVIGRFVCVRLVSAHSQQGVKCGGNIYVTKAKRRVFAEQGKTVDKKLQVKKRW